MWSFYNVNRQFMAKYDKSLNGGPNRIRGPGGTLPWLPATGEHAPWGVDVPSAKLDYNLDAPNGYGGACGGPNAAKDDACMMVTVEAETQLGSRSRYPSARVALPLIACTMALGPSGAEPCAKKDSSSRKACNGARDKSEYHVGVANMILQGYPQGALRYEQVNDNNYPYLGSPNCYPGPVMDETGPSGAPPQAPFRCACANAQVS